MNVLRSPNSKYRQAFGKIGFCFSINFFCHSQCGDYTLHTFLRHIALNSGSKVERCIFVLVHSNFQNLFMRSGFTLTVIMLRYYGKQSGYLLTSRRIYMCVIFVCVCVQTHVRVYRHLYVLSRSFY